MLFYSSSLDEPLEKQPGRQGFRKVKVLTGSRRVSDRHPLETIQVLLTRSRVKLQVQAEVQDQEDEFEAW